MGRDRDQFRKFESGSQKLKKKKLKEKFMKRQTGALQKFLIPSKENNPNTVELQCKIDVPLLPTSTSTSTSFLNENENYSEQDMSKNLSENLNDEQGIINNSNFNKMTSKPNDEVFQNFEDPGEWPSNLSVRERDIIIEKGPIEITIHDFPIKSSDNVVKRKFTVEHYNRILSNGEKVKRRWLIYSKKKDVVYCFCCKLFGNSCGSGLADYGLDDWKHISERIKSHENSQNHLLNTEKWISCEIRMKKNITIDKQNLALIRKETEHWRAVLTRILHVVHYLSERNLAFRGKSDTLFTSNNGNFLGLIEMLGKFDPIIIEHIRRIQSKEIHDHYLGKSIQNEFINMLASFVSNTIYKKISSEKYYSIILDCTPDLSHKEQLSIVLRCVDMHSEKIKIEEHFIKFLEIHSSTGENISLTILSELDKIGLNIKDCRGQGYDNGANMKGKYKGVQAKILQKNPKAFFTPCACHSLNLLLGDMAKCNSKAMTFFGIMNRIYTIFSGSPIRWSILIKNIPNCTVKRLSETRWESRIESVKPIKYHAALIRDSLLEIAETTNDSTIKSEAELLALNELENFEFIVSVVIWYDLLLSVNSVSKILQSSDMNLDVAVNGLKGLLKFLKNYRDTGFTSAIVDAKEIATILKINPVFKETRIRKIKRLFTYEQDEPINLNKTPEEKFKIEYFYQIVDTAIQSMELRFQQFEEYSNMFGFLYSPEKLRNISENDLMKCCFDLDISLRDGEKHDIDGAELFSELKILRQMIPEEINKSIEVLQFIKDLQNPFPNATVSYRILLTIPITVASAERSFSKLKLIKSYLRTSMTQERLTSLAILSIEEDIASNLDYNEIINEFARNKARKVNFV